MSISDTTEMATTTTTPSPEYPRFPSTCPGHPLDPLAPHEVRRSENRANGCPALNGRILQIEAVSLAVREYVADIKSIKAVHFITCSLLPPPKRVVLAHLRIPIVPGEEPEPPTPIVRKAEVDVGVLFP